MAATAGPACRSTPLIAGRGLGQRSSAAAERPPLTPSPYRAGARERSAMAERLPPGPPVIFCQDSPKRVLVSVIKTTPIKPSPRGGDEEPAPAPPIPTSPGFSDFMVYPWRWGENAHNVTLSPGGGTAAPSALPPPRGGAGRAPGGDEEKAGSPGSSRHRLLKVSERGARVGRAGGRVEG